MKTIRFFLTLAFFAGTVSFALAQTVTETLSVSGNCGMCKARIEKAAKDAGASEATWNKDTKQLTVSFASDATSVAKVQQKVAEVGHDNAAFKASDAVYAKLPGCCKYERAAAVDAAPAAVSCCQKGEAGKEGKCAKDAKCEKDAKSGKSTTCADSKDGKGGGCCSKKS